MIEAVIFERAYYLIIVGRPQVLVQQYLWRVFASPDQYWFIEVE
jgi:hypothetical protein